MKVFKNQSNEWTIERTKHISTEALYASRTKFNSKLLFIGSCYVPDASPHDKARIEELLLVEDCIPVFQDDLPAFGKYLDFCEAFLWPVMNNQLPLMEDTEILQWDDDLWKAYKSANELFCSKISAVVTKLNSRESSVKSYINVWVNDFHLILLPALLRRKLTKSTIVSSISHTPSSNITIGMYIHTPFPTSEIFLTLPVRSELMRGFLSADLVGFQFYDYTRHFFSGAQKLFGVRTTCQKGGLLALEVSEERNVFIHITHNCIEHEYVVEEASSRHVQRKATQIRNQYQNRVIIGSVDKLGRTSGILLKLRAFKLFLSQYEQFHNRIVLVLYIIARGAQKTTPEHFAIAEQAKELARSINDEFGLHVDICDKLENPSDKCALLCVSDVLLETSLKDGLNMVPFEYLAARDTWLKLEGTLDSLTKPDPPLSSIPLDEMDSEDLFGTNLVNACSKTGRIVISEFSGSSQVLPGAIRVNPWHIDTILGALDECLTMPLHIAKSQFIRDVSYVTSQSQVNWAREFSTQITRASLASYQYMNKVPSGVMLPTSEESGSSTPRSTIEPSSRAPAVASLVPATYSAIPKLDIQLVSQSFLLSKKRVFFFDNEGTLAPNLSRLYRHYGSIPLAQPTNTDLQSRGCGPSEDVIRMLTILCSDPRNIVMILSGRSQESLSKWFRSVPGIGLAVEHGYHWSHPMITGSSWRNLLVTGSSVDQPASSPSWMKLTGEIMNQYVNRTPNTYIEDKGSARVWQFRDAEAEFGQGQAKELHSELEVALRNDPVDITTGKGYVEVKIRGVNKGAAVEQILSALKTELNVVPDFVLSIGDDRSDEYMFEKLLEPVAAENACVYTATVGRKKTVAKYYISDVDSVTGLLAALTNSPNTPRRNASSSNFSSVTGGQ